MTWVSLRSGRASRGMVRMAQNEMNRAMTPAASTRNLFSAENRMIFWIMAGS